jgi:hypothetical protein
MRSWTRITSRSSGACASGCVEEACAEVVTDFLERHEALVINRAATVIHP